MAKLERVIAIARVSSTVMPALVDRRQVFHDKIVVFPSEDPGLLACLSSSPHHLWVVENTTSHGGAGDTTYAHKKCFETFPPLPKISDEMRQLGEQLDTHRRELMCSRQTGLTKTYNLVFDTNCQDEDIEELRRIHRAIDEAAIRAYGWEDRIEAVGGLDHGFHQVGRETRYTIGPAAQREILDSLLELNHVRYAEEVAQGLHAKKKGSRKPKPTKGTLF